MRSRGVLLTLLLLFVPLSAFSAEFRSDWIVVRLASPIVPLGFEGDLPLETGVRSVDALIRQTGVSRITPALPHGFREPADPAAFRRWGFDRTYRFHLSAGADVRGVAARFDALDKVDWAEPDWHLTPLETPNDPLFDSQWALHQDSDADVDAPEGWDVETGQGTVIAVLDTGVDTDHPDFIGRLVEGRNFEVDPPTTDVEDQNGHGTPVASIAAAATNDFFGMAGSCWDCRIMPIVIGVGTSAFADAVVWGTDNGARVMNLSQALANETHSQIVLNGVGYAYDAGVVFVAAGGNDNQNFVYSPASALETIAVGGTNQSDGRAAPICSGAGGAGSNYGPTMDVVAPAEFIKGANTSGGHSDIHCGTSHAAPRVTGLVGIMRTVNPSLGREEARHLVRAGADDEVGDPAEDTPGFDVYMGWGRVNFDRSLRATEASASLRVEGKSATRVFFETPNPLADSYDFIRGDLSALSESPLGVDTGDVVCLEDDSPDADTTGNEDTDTPAHGEAFFYVARFNGAPGAGSYGGSSRNRDRIAVTPAKLADVVLEGSQGSTQFGSDVRSAGDVNGDGYDDLIVGVFRYDNGETNEGAVFVYDGSPTGIDPTAAWSVESDQAGAELGWSASGAGDVNGDGYDDVIVGARKFDSGESDEGKVWVYHGSAAGLLAAPSWSFESDQADAWLGSRVRPAGDVNGDGYHDVAVNARNYDGGQTDEGKVFVFYGSASGLSTNPDWQFETGQASARVGGLDAGDVNGDGYDDLVLGSPFYDDGETNEGRIFVFHGSPTGLSTTPDAERSLDVVAARLGAVDGVAAAGDIDGNGYDDVVAGAWGYDGTHPKEGAVFLYPGSVSGIAASPSWSFTGGQKQARLGISVSYAGDLDGDGFDDLAAGAYWFDEKRTDEGKTFVFSGSSTGPPAAASWSETGFQSGAEYGRIVSFAGDVNGDGLADLAVASMQYNASDFEQGRAYVYHGPLNDGPAPGTGCAP